MERRNPVAVFILDLRNVDKCWLRSSISDSKVQPFAFGVGGELTVRNLRVHKRHGHFASAAVARQYRQQGHPEQETKRHTTNQNKSPMIHELSFRQTSRLSDPAPPIPG